MPTIPPKHVLQSFVFSYMNNDDLGAFMQTQSMFKDAAARALFQVRGAMFTYRESQRRCLDELPYDENETVFLRAIKRGDVNTCKRLVSEENADRAFATACLYGQLEIAMWIRQTFKHAVAAQMGFYQACRGGSLSILSWLQSILALTVDQTECALIYATLGGHLHVIEWLVEGKAMSEILSQHVASFWAVACKNGHLPVARWWLSRTEEPTRDQYISCFDDACTYGHLHVARWLWDVAQPIFAKDDWWYLLSDVSERGHLHVIQWLMSTVIQSSSSPDDYEDVIDAFYEALENGHLHVAKYIMAMFSDFSSQKKLYDVDEDYVPTYDAFCSACSNGHLHVAQWMLETMHVPQCKDSHTFHNVCVNGHVRVAKWLRSISWADEKFMQYSPTMFTKTCENGNLQLAQYLASTFTVTSSDATDAFQGACSRDHIEVAVWLLNTYEIDTLCAHTAFQKACSNGYVNMAKWLYNYFNLPIEYGTTIHAYTEACSSHNIGLVLWLHRLLREALADFGETITISSAGNIARNNLFLCGGSLVHCSGNEIRAQLLLLNQ
jgi:hypothetical protein